MSFPAYWIEPKKDCHGLGLSLATLWSCSWKRTKLLLQSSSRIMLRRVPRSLTSSCSARHILTDQLGRACHAPSHFICKWTTACFSSPQKQAWLMCEYGTTNWRSSITQMSVDVRPTSSLYSRPTSRWWITCKHADEDRSCRVNRLLSSCFLAPLACCSYSSGTLSIKSCTATPRTSANLCNV